MALLVDDSILPNHSFNPRTDNQKQKKKNHYQTNINENRTNFFIVRICRRRTIEPVHWCMYLFINALNTQVRLVLRHYSRFYSTKEKLSQDEKRSVRILIDGWINMNNMSLSKSLRVLVCSIGILMVENDFISCSIEVHIDTIRIFQCCFLSWCWSTHSTRCVICPFGIDTISITSGMSLITFDETKLNE